jgi:hypothetical protein
VPDRVGSEVFVLQKFPQMGPQASATERAVSLFRSDERRARGNVPFNATPSFVSFDVRAIALAVQNKIVRNALEKNCINY